MSHLRKKGATVMIARVWHGTTAEWEADRYLDYLKATGVAALRGTEGNRGVQVFRRISAGRAEFFVISLWDSFEAIQRFAGDDVDRAVYYPEDQKYLLALEPKVTHYDVFAEDL